ncbi:hypothetical protein ACQP25_44980 (plasmid) [Microtetraspora malaysiensis]|uniref:hypothetical protein n=1 Tax=Microtetraspora malaysiensis TaxID=161358 RepID=UPI003D930573
MDNLVRMPARDRRPADANPPPRIPEPVHDRMEFIGCRVVVACPNRRWLQDMRAVSNVTADERGRPVVHLVPEGEWYLLALTGSYSDGTITSKVETHPAHRVYVEVLHEAFSAASTLT